MAAVTVEELLKETELRPERLDERTTDNHLCEIALFLTSWRKVVAYLELSKIDLDDVEQEGKDEQEKRLKALQKWKSKFAFKATYRKLVDILLSLSMADIAEKVCQLLKNASGHTGSSCIPAKSKGYLMTVLCSLIPRPGNKAIWDLSG